MPDKKSAEQEASGPNYKLRYLFALCARQMRCKRLPELSLENTVERRNVNPNDVNNAIIKFLILRFPGLPQRRWLPALLISFSLPSLSFWYPANSTGSLLIKFNFRTKQFFSTRSLTFFCHRIYPPLRNQIEAHQFNDMAEMGPSISNHQPVESGHSLDIKSSGLRSHPP